ncbi:unnamed protein product [Didymodactylos carnosus]|uniref:Lysosomal cobalamin transporter n=1 Tax=Didymodactylos carnosus TaxID=1234261 RepID=A0A815UIP9_9BILA|nr:unnamed protein product [Didymodactylos carnosus]CAF4374738.1 unnamed protein product [Didymodactylos carnosus]
MSTIAALGGWLPFAIVALDWAQNKTDRDHIQEFVLIGYYVLYGLIIVLAFFLNPFMYFYYEEKEEDEKVSTSYGSIGLPLSFIRGRQSARLQQTEIEQQRTNNQDQIRSLKNRYPRHVSMPAHEKRLLEELEQQEAVLLRNEELIRSVRSSFLFKCRHVYRPLQIVIGIILLCIALLIFLSLLLSNIDKSIHFVDFKQIFAQGNRTLPNPLDIVVTWTGQFYPANYIILSCVLIYIILTSLYGLQQVGIYYFCIKMFRFSRGRTKPQALLLLCSLFMFIVLAINIFVYLLMPQYTIYGDQRYLTNGTVASKPCTQFVDANDCTMTVMGGILLRFLYKVWIFGVAYFIISWLYLAVFLFGCLYKIFKHRESNIHVHTVENLLDDEEDDPLIDS